MKKSAILLVVMLALVSVLATTAFAATPSDSGIEYYDADANRIYGSDMYHDDYGYPLYGPGCYYYNTAGDPVYVGGCRIYYYDTDGELYAGSHYYDGQGNQVAPPSRSNRTTTRSTRGYGCGCGCGGGRYY